MKKLILILSFILMIGIAKSQNFPGTHVELIKGKQLKVNELDDNFKEFGYSGFYKDINLKKVYKKKGIGTKHDALEGKVFSVVEIIPYTAKYTDDENYKLKIYNDEIGTLYFDYNPKYEHKWEFEVVGGLELPKDFYCEKIKKKVDKFNGEINYYTPYSSGFGFIANIKGNTKEIYLKVNQPGSTFNVGKKGLYLLLDNGKKIERPNAEIDVKVSGRDYIYSAFINLTDSEIDMLTNSIITDKRLYIYDGVINEKNGRLIQEYLKCLEKI